MRDETLCVISCTSLKKRCSCLALSLGITGLQPIWMLPYRHRWYCFQTKEPMSCKMRSGRAPSSRLLIHLYLCHSFISASAEFKVIYLWDTVTISRFLWRQAVKDNRDLKKCNFYESDTQFKRKRPLTSGLVCSNLFQNTTVMSFFKKKTKKNILNRNRSHKMWGLKAS